MEADSMLIGSALDYYGLIGARGMSLFYFSADNLGGKSQREINDIFRYDCNLLDKSI